jgi:hypothetical protein
LLLLEPLLDGLTNYGPFNSQQFFIEFTGNIRLKRSLFYMTACQGGFGPICKDFSGFYFLDMKMLACEQKFAAKSSWKGAFAKSGSSSGFGLQSDNNSLLCLWLPPETDFGAQPIS